MKDHSVTFAVNEFDITDIEDVDQETIDRAYDRAAAVLEYALQHYNEDGWDFLIECHETHEIAAVVIDEPSVERSIARVADEFDLKLHAERREEHYAEIF